MNILLWGDPHLNSTEDIEKYSEIDQALDSIDLAVVVGDVVDPIPRDRGSKEEIQEDIEVGRSFTETLSKAGRDNGFDTIAVPGNHDYDIFDDLVEGLPNVHNIHRTYMEGEELGIDEDLRFVGMGADSFDLHPEVKPTDYRSLTPENSDSFSREEYENILRSFSNSEYSFEDTASILDIQRDEQANFNSQAKDYLRNYNNFSMNAGSRSKTAYITHIAPFNTKNDTKKINDIDSEGHWGSVSLKNAILDYKPEMVLHGHNNEELSFDYLEMENDNTPVLEAGEGNVALVNYNSGGSFSFNDL